MINLTDIADALIIMGIYMRVPSNFEEI